MTDEQAKRILVDFVFFDFDMDKVAEKHISNWNELNDEAKKNKSKDLFREACKQACLALGKSWGLKKDDRV